LNTSSCLIIFVRFLILEQFNSEFVRDMLRHQCGKKSVEENLLFGITERLKTEWLRIEHFLQTHFGNDNSRLLRLLTENRLSQLSSSNSQPTQRTPLQTSVHPAFEIDATAAFKLTGFSDPNFQRIFPYAIQLPVLLSNQVPKIRPKVKNKLSEQQIRSILPNSLMDDTILNVSCEILISSAKNGNVNLKVDLAPGDLAVALGLLVSVEQTMRNVNSGESHLKTREDAILFIEKVAKNLMKSDYLIILLKQDRHRCCLYINISTGIVEYFDSKSLCTDPAIYHSQRFETFWKDAVSKFGKLRSIHQLATDSWKKSFKEETFWVNVVKQTTRSSWQIEKHLGTAYVIKYLSDRIVSKDEVSNVAVSTDFNDKFLQFVFIPFWKVALKSFCM
jgi:hypothetical protein